MHPNWVPSGTPEFIKNHQKSIPVPSSDLLSAPGCPWMSQMSIQGAKMIQKGIKKGSQNTHLDSIISMATRVGTGGRGGALRSVPTPKGCEGHVLRCLLTCSSGNSILSGPSGTEGPGEVHPWGRQLPKMTPNLFLKVIKKSLQTFGA